MCYPGAVQPCPACRSAARLFACETCHDTGDIEVMTQGLGPDDYAEKIACPDCGDLDVWMQAQQENYRLREALLACVAVAKAWHAADDVWEIYYNHSPEMKPIRDVLGPLP